MPVTVDDIERWLSAKETEHLEFKEAKNTFSLDETKRYFVALANEGGGKLVLGISPTLPRRVVGSQAFPNVDALKYQLHTQFRMRPEIDEVQHPGGRVFVLHVPSRPVGDALHIDGAYLMRVGENLVPMSGDRLRTIFAEAVPDYSALVVSGAQRGDLDEVAIQRMMDLWSGTDARKRALGAEQVLSDLALVTAEGVTVAALVLLGSSSALRRHLPAAEIVYEYRLSDGDIAYAQRKEWRSGFLGIMDDVWNAVAARTDVHHFQEGFFMRDVPTLREDVVREAVLNGICHRDYRSQGSVWLKQWPRRLEVASPGGLPHGVTVENILFRQMPRNRLIADTLRHVGLVERSGQGMDKIFRRQIEDAKLPPDFSQTDEHGVVLTISGEVQDPRFLRYLEKVGQEALASFSTLDFMVLDHVRRGVPLPEVCKARVNHLIDLGVIERVAKGTLLLSKRLYEFLGERGTYTRRKGLDQEAQKMLIEQHLRDVAPPEGAAFQELMQVLGPATVPGHLKHLLRVMRAERRIHLTGKTRSGRWRLGSGG